MTPPNLWQCLIATQDFSRCDPATSAAQQWWRSKDGQTCRGYAPTRPANDGLPWIELQGVVELPGASHGQQAAYHYVVETDVQAQHLAATNEWYEVEHLPGLAAVPGTVRARRYLRLQGRPRLVACYDLVTPAAMERPEWLAIRHTEWSSKIRPLFQNTFRTLYAQATPGPV